MAALERLFMEIFDGRARIEGQLWQQADAYTDSLATNLLAEGCQLPHWLWPGGQHKESSKEEWISGASFHVKQAITPSVKQSSVFALPSLRADSICQYNDTFFNRENMENRFEIGPSNYPVDDGQDCRLIKESNAAKCGAEYIYQFKCPLTDECTTGSNFNTENICNDPKNEQMIEDSKAEVTDADIDADSMFHSNGFENVTCASGRCCEMEDVSEARPSNYFKDVVQDSPMMDESGQMHAELVSDSVFQSNGLFMHSLNRDLNTENRSEAELIEHLKDGEQDAHMMEVSTDAQSHSELEADSNRKFSGLLPETCMPGIYFNADNWSEEQFPKIINDVGVDTRKVEELGATQSLAVSELTDNTEFNVFISTTCTLGRSFNKDICTEAGLSNCLSDGSQDCYMLEEMKDEKVHAESEPSSQYSRARQMILEVRQDKKVDFMNLLDKENRGHASTAITRSLPTSLNISSEQKSDGVTRSASGNLRHNVVDRAQELEQLVCPSQSNNVHISPGDTMPEFEGFRVDLPSISEGLEGDSDIPCLQKERVSLLEKLGRSLAALSPVSQASSRHKINEIPDAYQSLPAEIFKQNNLLSSFQFDDAIANVSGAKNDGNFSGLCCDIQADIAGNSVERMHSLSLPSSSLRSAAPIGKPHLTPPAGKLTQRVGPGRSVSSEHLGSKHVCFRIDESSITTEEDCLIDKVEVDYDKKDGHMFENVLNDRKPLMDVTSVYQNAPATTNTSLQRISLDSVCTDYTNLSMVDTDLGFEFENVLTMSKIDNKENRTSAQQYIARKTAESLCSGSSKTGFLRKGGNRSRISGKGDKPSNIVSRISSFIPLVRRKQEQQAAAPFAGKRNIKVKALETAEATKRIEEKKQIEREIRKAALKVERENARQLALKQKSINEIKKKEAEAAKQLVLKQKEIDVIRKKDVKAAARKRQRGEEEKKDKECKRRCLDEVGNQQKEQGGSVHSEKEVKELQHVIAETHQRRNLTDNVKSCVNLEEGIEPTESKEDAEVQHVNSNLGGRNPEALDVGKMVVNLDGSQSRVQDRRSFIKGSHDTRSYEVSPYRDSDDEDGEGDRRKKKYVPLWARRECLEKILLSMQGRDPTQIFARKSSFNLVKVLSPRLHRQIL